MPYSRSPEALEISNFVAKWSASAAAERANKDAFLIELCDVLGVPRPEPATGDPERDLYVFEREVHLPHEGDRLTIGRIDLYHHNHFLLEAKQGSDEGSKKLGTARRGTPAWNIAMRDAYGQALGYARTLSDPPPFLVTCDIGYCFDLYAAFDKTWNYRPFPDGQSSRIYLSDLEKYADRLRAIFLAPLSLDPARHSARVTREIAAHLADLAVELEEAGHTPERVATFLMRSIFTIFAEDVGLLPDHLFTDALNKYWIPAPQSFPSGISSLWKAMNDGSSFGFLGKLLRFNGGLFADQQALPLTRSQLERLKEAARCNWADVEPAIFGTLLERALDPRERHRLGAHYTPRSFVERLVRPTIEEPLRADWDLVRAEVRRHVEDGRVEDAQKAVRSFHRLLTKTRVLDPACGSGNFLYVSLDLFKRLESEVIGLLHDLGETQELLEIEGATVTPEQFLGIEVKRWAKEIAELVLWIGYIQWQVRARGSAKAIPEPVLRDYGNIEHRDAVLSYDQRELVVDDKGLPLTRWDGTTYKRSAVTGEEIPDESARVPVYRYRNPRAADWPTADFIVGNPPFVGNWLMRETLGEGYAEALRQAYKTVPKSADYVMYWWNQAAELLSSGLIRRFGFITTKSITQARNNKVLQSHLGASKGVSIVFATPNHPWTDSSGAAAVRIAITVVKAGEASGLLSTVSEEREAENGEVELAFVARRGKIQANLSIGPEVLSAVPLRANRGLCSPGVKLHGADFIVSTEQARNLGLGRTQNLELHVREYRNGRDITSRPRGVMVIDLFGLDIAEVRARFPEIYQFIYERIRLKREARAGNTKDSSEYAAKWWLLGKPRAELRKALRNLSRFIATVETTKHRVFTFLPTSILPDNMLINIAVEDAFFLGVLSSRIHVQWALAAGGRLGVGNDPRYTKTKCFDPFPFPMCREELIIYQVGVGVST